MQWIPSALLSVHVYIQSPRNFHLARKICFYLVPLFSCLSLSAEDEELCIIINCHLLSLICSCVRNG